MKSLGMARTDDDDDDTVFTYEHGIPLHPHYACPASSAPAPNSG
jgi:hypothetical protein